MAEKMEREEHVIRKALETTLDYAKTYYAKILELGMKELFEHARRCKLLAPTWQERLYNEVFKTFFLNGKLTPSYPEDLDEAAELVLMLLYSRDAEVLKMRYGAYGECMSCAEIGKRLGVSGGRIQQVEARALRRLRHPNRSRLLSLGEKEYREQLKRAREEEEKRQEIDLALAEFRSKRYENDEGSEDWISTSPGTALTDANLDVRLFNALCRAGYQTLAEVYAAGPEAIARVQHLGERSFEKLVAILHELGIVRPGDLWSVYAKARGLKV